MATAHCRSPGARITQVQTRKKPRGFPGGLFLAQELGSRLPASNLAVTLLPLRLAYLLWQARHTLLLVFAIRRKVVLLVCGSWQEAHSTDGLVTAPANARLYRIMSVF